MLCISWAALMEKAVLSLFSFPAAGATKPRLMAFRAGMHLQHCAQSRCGGLPVCSVRRTIGLSKVTTRAEEIERKRLAGIDSPRGCLVLRARSTSVLRTAADVMPCLCVLHSHLHLQSKQAIKSSRPGCLDPQDALSSESKWGRSFLEPAQGRA